MNDQHLRSQWLTPEQVAAALQISRRTVYRRVKNGKIPHRYEGAQIRIPLAYIEEGDPWAQLLNAPSKVVPWPAMRSTG